MVRLICTRSREGGRSVSSGKKQREMRESQPVAYPQGKREECASHGEHNPQLARRANREPACGIRSPAAASDAKGNAKKEGGSAISEGTASVSIHGASRGLDVSCSCVVWCGEIRTLLGTRADLYLLHNLTYASSFSENKDCCISLSSSSALQLSNIYQCKPMLCAVQYC
jgi:hypothetical protein